MAFNKSFKILNLNKIKIVCLLTVQMYDWNTFVKMMFPLGCIIEIYNI